MARAGYVAADAGLLQSIEAGVVDCPSPRRGVPGSPACLCVRWSGLARIYVSEYSSQAWCKCAFSQPQITVSIKL